MQPNTRKPRGKAIVLTALGLILALFLAGKVSGAFDTFNKDHLIKAAFGMDLTPYMEKEKTTYSDGCLQFHGINETHPLYVHFFPSPPDRTFYVSFLHETFDEDDNITYREIGSHFDGYAPVVIYIPRLKRLVYGYSDGMGG